MHHHAGRLIDDREVSVFINDVQRDFFGNGPQRRKLGLAENRDGFAAAKAQRSFRHSVIDQNFFCGDQLLDAGAAGFLKSRSEELVETLTGIFDGYDDCDRIVRQDCRIANGMARATETRRKTTLPRSRHGLAGSGVATQPPDGPTHNYQAYRDQLGTAHDTAKDRAAAGVSAEKFEEIPGHSVKTR